MRYLIKEVNCNKRLDVFVSSLGIGLSRSYAHHLINGGNILANNKKVKPSYKVKLGDEVEINLPPSIELKAIPEKIPLKVIYEDSNLIVINKPRGMVVHPAAGNYTGTLVNALLAHCKDLSGIGGVLRPGIVHRLDKDTSGLIVAAKNDEAHQSLSKQFKEHAVKKVYVALAFGWPKKDKETIEEPIGRHPVHRKKMAVVKSEQFTVNSVQEKKRKLKAREAVTHYSVIDRFTDEEGNKYSLLELNIETGRTHQIRVHLSHIGHSIVGDAVYGLGKCRMSNVQCQIKGQLLHAKLLGFVHPSTGKYVEFRAEIPDDMKNVLDLLKQTKNI